MMESILKVSYSMLADNLVLTMLPISMVSNAARKSELYTYQTCFKNDNISLQSNDVDFRHKVYKEHLITNMRNRSLEIVETPYASGKIRSTNH